MGNSICHNCKCDLDVPIEKDCCLSTKKDFFNGRESSFNERVMDENKETINTKDIFIQGNRMPRIIRSNIKPVDDDERSNGETKGHQTGFSHFEQVKLYKAKGVKTKSSLEYDDGLVMKLPEPKRTEVNQRTARKIIKQKVMRDDSPTKYPNPSKQNDVKPNLAEKTDFQDKLLNSDSLLICEPNEDIFLRRKCNEELHNCGQANQQYSQTSSKNNHTNQLLDHIDDMVKFTTGSIDEDEENDSLKSFNELDDHCIPHKKESDSLDSIAKYATEKMQNNDNEIEIDMNTDDLLQKTRNGGCNKGSKQYELRNFQSGHLSTADEGKSMNKSTRPSERFISSPKDEEYEFKTESLFSNKIEDKIVFKTPVLKLSEFIQKQYELEIGDQQKEEEEEKQKALIKEGIEIIKEEEDYVDELINHQLYDQSQKLVQRTNQLKNKLQTTLDVETPQPKIYDTQYQVKPQIQLPQPQLRKRSTHYKSFSLLNSMEIMEKSNKPSLKTISNGHHSLKSELYDPKVNHIFSTQREFQTKQNQPKPKKHSQCSFDAISPTGRHDFLEKILFHSEMSKVTFPNKTNNKKIISAKVFVTVSKHELKYYRSKEIYITLQKPTEVINLNQIVRSEVNSLATNKNIDHCIIKYFSYEDDTEDNNETDQSQRLYKELVFNSDKVGVAKKLHSLLNQLVKTKN